MGKEITQKDVKFYCPKCGDVTAKTEFDILGPGQLDGIQCPECKTYWDIKIAYFEAHPDARR
jgi:phage FluMu protein Com